MIVDRPSSPSIHFVCNCIGSEHKQIVSENEGSFGIVLNAFDRTLNVKTKDDKLLVISLGKVASPLTINVVHLDNPPVPFNSFINHVKSGDTISLANRQETKNVRLADVGPIMLGDKFIIHLKKPNRFFESRLEKMDLHAIQKLSDHAITFISLLKKLASSNNEGCLLNPDITTDGLLSEFMTRILYEEKAGVDLGSPTFGDVLSMSLLGLCGRGPGFTPAGDDFISGFLTILNRILVDLNVGTPIIPGLEYRNLTTWTSFKLMESSAKGLVDSEVQNMINCIANGDLLGYEDLVTQIAKRGHTSGLDFATGAMVALYVVMDTITCRTIDRSLTYRFWKDVIE